MTYIRAALVQLRLTRGPNRVIVTQTTQDRS